MAIFYRQNSLSRNFEDALRDLNLPYKIIGGIRFYDRAEIKDLLAYLHCAVNPHNSIHLLRIINKPKRGLGDKTIEEAISYGNAHQMSLFTAFDSMLKEGLFKPRASCAR